MALIRFIDGRGVEWEVWEVGVRAADAASHGGRPAPTADQRWLCFQSGTERRRLATYPQRWHAMTPKELDALLRAASAAGLSRHTPTDSPAQDGEP